MCDTQHFGIKAAFNQRAKRKKSNDCTPSESVVREKKKKTTASVAKRDCAIVQINSEHTTHTHSLQCNISRLHFTYTG